MRWAPLAVVAALAIALLVWSDPQALRPVGGVGAEVAARSGAARGEYQGPCRVARVLDGDTLDVRCGASTRPERVRLLRIDTPEREEPGYREAARALRELVRGRPLQLVFEDPQAPVRDRYGRLLAYVYAGERNLNVAMVSLGWSRFEVGFGPGRFAESFAAAEREARAVRRGLWAARE